MAVTSRKLAAAGFMGLVLALIGSTGAASAGEDLLGTPAVSAARLAETRGGAEPVASTLGRLSATSSGNVSEVILDSPLNTIHGGALRGAQGAFTLIQNIGNNAIIQTSTSIVVNYVGR